MKSLPIFLKRHLAFFKTPFYFSLLMSFLIAYPGINFGQNRLDSTIYFSVQYMKTAPVDGISFRDLVRSYSKKLNEELVKSKAILGWYLWEVRMPSGENQGYNLATVTVYDNFKSIFQDTLTLINLYKKVFPTFTDNIINDILYKFTERRKFIKREIYTNLALATQDKNTTPSTFALIDFMQAPSGKEPEYINYEKRLFVPIHKARADIGVIRQWGLYQKQMPNNDNSEYNFITVHFFDDINAVTDPKYGEVLQKLYPKQDFMKINNQDPGSRRKLVKTELWHLREYITANGSSQ